MNAVAGARLSAVRILADGRPGHQNQSIGLAEALARRTGAQVETVNLDPAASLWSRVKAARADGERRPELIVAAGHRTHVPLLMAARRFSARSIVIMRPSLPACWFDLCLVPRHDLAGKRPAPNTVATWGALNRLPEERAPKTSTGMVLIGGASAHHEWEALGLAEAVREVVTAGPTLGWTVADSRRTPADFLSTLQAEGIRADCVSHAQTGPGWLPSRLAEASEVWVTEDSASMVFEALTAGARVGLLPLPARSGESRIVRSMDDLVSSGVVARYSSWRSGGRRLPEPSRLHEAVRCAELVLARFFPQKPVRVVE
jgi:mitochondrial fission protein ELM1